MKQENEIMIDIEKFWNCGIESKWNKNLAQYKLRKKRFDYLIFHYF